MDIQVIYRNSEICCNYSELRSRWIGAASYNSVELWYANTQLSGKGFFFLGQSAVGDIANELGDPVSCFFWGSVGLNLHVVAMFVRLMLTNVIRII